MARYNSVITSATASTTATFQTPNSGVFTEFTGTSYNVTIGDPVLYAGQSQYFYNSASGTITLQFTTAGGGFFKGPGQPNNSTNLAMPSGSTVSLYSDGTNWVTLLTNGGNLLANTFTANSTVTLSPSSTVTISPTGNVTMSPTGTVTIAPTSTLTLGTTSQTTTMSGNVSFAGTVSGTGLNSLISAPPVGVGSVTATSGAFTSLSASSTVSGSGFSTYLASPPSIGTTTAGIGTFTTLTCTSLTENSSITFKTNIEPIGNPLDSIMKLVGVTYDRKDGSQKNEPGLIAEDVYKVIPELVQLKDGKPFGIHYTKLGAYLVECIKSLQSEIDELNGKKVVAKKIATKKTKGLK